MADVPLVKATGEADTYAKGVAITKSDTVDFASLSRAIWVGGVGDIVLVWQDNTTSTLSAVAAGTLLKVMCRRVNSTNTTATLMVALF